MSTVLLLLHALAVCAPGTARPQGAGARSRGGSRCQRAPLAVVIGRREPHATLVLPMARCARHPTACGYIEWDETCRGDAGGL